MYNGVKVIDVHGHMSTPVEFSNFSVNLVNIRKLPRNRSQPRRPDRPGSGDPIPILEAAATCCRPAGQGRTAFHCHGASLPGRAKPLRCSWARTW